MLSSVPNSPSNHKLCRTFHFGLVEQLYPRQRILEVLNLFHRKEIRERKLNAVFMVYFVIAMTMFPDDSLSTVYAHLTQLLRWCEELALSVLPTAAAFVYRRRQLGVRVFRHLLALFCVPFADPVHQPQAFVGRYRLMAIDGRLQSVQDTTANRAFFGKNESTPFPQARLLMLIEVGTHLCCDLVYGVVNSQETDLVWGLLRSLTPDMLLLWDRAFMGPALLEAVRARRTHILGRLPAIAYTKRRWKTLSDGSYLIRLLPSDYPGLKKPLVLRVIEYEFVGPRALAIAQVTPSRCAHGFPATNAAFLQRHRLVTTLLNPRTAPALDCCERYHERWESENVYDEQKNHLWEPNRPLRSKFPTGVVQELYAQALGHYVIQIMMTRAAAAVQIDHDRISFTRARQLIQQQVTMAASVSEAVRSTLPRQLMAELVVPHNLLPPRRMRFNSRVIKRTQSRYRPKRPEQVFLTFKKFCFQQLIRLI